MIFHCSARLVEKLPGKPPKKAAVPSLGMLQNWHASFFSLQRRQCVLFCEDSTRFMLFAGGLNKSHFQYIEVLFMELFTEALINTCQVDSQQADLIVSLCCDRWFADTTTDRSVQGSMNIAGRDLKCYFMDRKLMDTPRTEVQQWLNHRPVTVKGRSDCLWPDKEMTALIQQVVQAR